MAAELANHVEHPTSIIYASSSMQKNTPFGVYCLRSDIKILEARTIARMIRNDPYLHMHEGLEIFDAGAGDGYFQDSFLGFLHKGETAEKKIHFSWLDKNEQHMYTLVKMGMKINEFGHESLYTDQKAPYTATVFNEKIENFVPDAQYDYILFGHTFYYLEPEDQEKVLSKLVSFLKPGGKLIITIRSPDDFYGLIKRYYKRAHGLEADEKTVDTVIPLVNDLMNEYPDQLSYTQQQIESDLEISFEENAEEAIAIMEFALNKPWEELDPRLSEDIKHDIQHNYKGKLKERTSIVVISKYADASYAGTA